MKKVQNQFNLSFANANAAIILLLVALLFTSSSLLVAADDTNANANANDGAGQAQGYDSSDRTVYDFEADFGGIAYNYSTAALQHNTQTLSDILRYNASYNSLFFADKIFHFHPGVYGTEITDFELVINGTLRFHRPNETYVNHYNRPEPCILIEDSTDLLVTSPDPADTAVDFDDDFIDTDYASAKRGIIDGAGYQYWGVPFIGYLELVEFRPDLFVLNRTENVMIEYMIFRDAGLYTLNLVDSEHLEIQYSSVVARRTNDDGHSLLDLSAFNTDGIDVSGNDVYIHDVDIWNQDDCIAVKDSPYFGVSSNMLFERITASGLGLTIGSIGGTTVSNITFRDSLLYKTYKGIYMKFRHDHYRDTPGLVENILFENITIFEPQQWGIWIGPAQQSINGNPCKANPCSLCWPTVPFTTCKGIQESKYRNITLRDIYIYHPLGSPGVILADESNPIENITFDNVVVSNDIPSQFKNVERSKMFAGLNEPIQDSYTHPVKVWLYVIGFCILIVGLVWLVGFAFISIVRRTSRSGESAVSQEPLLQQREANMAAGAGGGGSFFASKKMIAVIVASVVVAAVVQKEMKISEETYNVQNYFSCEGVMNGVATGNTWPVPSCFADETGQSTE